jgi:hypothetical protein
MQTFYHIKSNFLPFSGNMLFIPNTRKTKAYCFFHGLFSKIFSSDLNFFNSAKLRSRELHATNLQSFRQETEDDTWFS